MPLTINVGLSRKRSANYQSEGTSINLTAELDQSLLARPADLQRQVDDLYEQAQRALERQAGAEVHAEDERAQAPAPSSNGHGESNGRENRSTASRNGWARNGQGGAASNGGTESRSGGGGGGMTTSQERAIHAIPRRVGVDPADEARHEWGLELGRLSVREASRLIDHLKALQGAATSDAGRNGR